MTDPMTDYIATPPMKKPLPRSTAEILTEAAQSFRRAHSGLRPMTPRDLWHEASRLWAVQRKQIIDAGARRVLGRVSSPRLHALYPAVEELVYEQGWNWETPTDDEAVRQFVAWGLACLRWQHWAQRDPALDFNLTVEDAAAWIAAHRPPEQLSLFGPPPIATAATSPATVWLPDGYNGHKVECYTTPVQTDGDLVLLRVVGSSYLLRWATRAQVAAACAVAPTNCVESSLPA